MAAQIQKAEVKIIQNIQMETCNMFFVFMYYGVNHEMYLSFNNPKMYM